MPATRSCLLFRDKLYTFPDRLRLDLQPVQYKDVSQAMPAFQNNVDFEEQTVRIGGTLWIPDILRQLGHDPAEVLAEVDLDQTLFDDPDRLVSYAARSRLISHCATRTGCEHFGLLIGQRGGLHSLGMIGFLIKNCVDARSALHTLVRFSHLHVSAAEVCLEESGEWVTLSYQILRPEYEARVHVYDGAVATMFNIVRTLCGPDWVPAEVLFSHHKPASDKAYRDFFRAPLVFNAEQNGLVFQSRTLDCKIADADPELHRILDRQVENLDQKNGDDFLEKITRLIGSGILMGYSREEDIAALLAMHPRTLRRRLHQFETSFQLVADQCRYNIARQLLEISDIPMSGIAAALAYADASAFTRAFRRWSGTTPARYRATWKRSTS